MAALANAKHESVALAYLADPEKIGWRAYKKIYPKSSQKAAAVGFSRLLTDANFAARVAGLHEQAAQGAVMTATEVLEELSKLGRSNMQHFVSVGADDTGEVIRSLRDLPPEHAAAIQEMTIETYTEGGGEDARPVKRVKLKLVAKTPALDLLGKHHKLFVDRVEHSFAGGIAERLASALARTDGKKQRPAPDGEEKGQEKQRKAVRSGRRNRGHRPKGGAGKKADTRIRGTR